MSAVHQLSSVITIIALHGTVVPEQLAFVGLGDIGQDTQQAGFAAAIGPTDQTTLASFKP
ncbi:hypothetical protein AFAE65S_03640 [Alcaligenes phenolicus]